jgi:hypothetical protein
MAASIVKGKPASDGGLLTLAPRPKSSRTIDAYPGWNGPVLQALSDENRERYARGELINGRRPTFYDDSALIEIRGAYLLVGGVVAGSVVCAAVLLLVGFS